MTKTKPQEKRPVRLSRTDYVRRFCQLNEDYIRDWKKIRKWFDPKSYPLEPEISASRGGKRVVTLYKSRIKKGKGWYSLPHPESAKCSEDINSFLDRWPRLRHPIPPEEGATHPGKYEWCLRPVVELIKEKLPEGKQGTGKLIRSPSGLRSVFSGDVTCSRYIKVQIDLFGSTEEITKEVMAVVNNHRELNYPSLGILLPKPNAKESVTRGDDYPRLVIGTYVGAGKRNIKKTAEILYPKSYKYENDQAEVDKELDEDVEKYDSMGTRMKCSTKRRRERQNHERLIRDIVDINKRAVTQ